MTTRTWFGGTGDESNPANWIPNGVPQPNDVLIMSSGTMNVTGSDASYNVTIGLDITGTGHINLSQNADGPGDLNVGVDGTATFDVKGTNTLNLFPGGGSTTTVNLSQGATVFGMFHNSGNVAEGVLQPPSFLTVSGPPHSTFVNQGGTYVYSGNWILNVDVSGTGNLSVIGGSKLELGGSVGSDQTFYVGTSSTFVYPVPTVAQIDEPSQFHGLVNLINSAGNPVGEIDLMKLANADSYTYQNDMLTIFSGKKVIDTLRLHDSSPYGFVIEETSHGVAIVGINDPTNPPIGLPVHTGA